MAKRRKIQMTKLQDTKALVEASKNALKAGLQAATPEAAVTAFKGAVGTAINTWIGGTGVDQGRLTALTGPIYTPVAEGLRGLKEDPSNPQAIQAYAKAVGNIYGPALGYTDEIATEEGWAPDPKDVRESLEQKLLK